MPWLLLIHKEYIFSTDVKSVRYVTWKCNQIIETQTSTSCLKYAVKTKIIHTPKTFTFKIIYRYAQDDILPVVYHFWHALFLKKK